MEESSRDVSSRTNRGLSERGLKGFLPSSPFFSTCNTGVSTRKSVM